MSGLITADYQVDLDGLLLGDGTPYGLVRISGWQDMPPVRSNDQPRARQHGAHAGQDLADPRVVEIHVEVSTADPGALSALRSRFVPGRFMTLWVRLPDEGMLSAQVRVRRAPVPVDKNHELGLTTVAFQVAATDPRRYGPVPAPQTTGLPTSSGGLVYPLTYPLDYGTVGDTGRVVLANPGGAEAWPRFDLAGPFPQGFEISAAGRRLVHPADLPAGGTLLLDSAAGAVLREGTADRRSDLTVAEWFSVPARGSLTVQLTSLGGAYSPVASMAATVVPTYW